MSTETMESAAADAAAAPLDVLLTDAALGVLNRVNPGGSGLRLAAALAARPRLVASRTRNLLGELTRIARYQVAKDCPEDPAEWLRRAETCHGPWWPDHVAWLAERCGAEEPAPAELGGGGPAPICDAPGTWVYDR